MSSLSIHDLAHEQALDSAGLAAVRGGASSLSALGEPGRFASVNVEVNQTIAQFQDIEVNALNNIGVIGAGFGPFRLDVSPKQIAAANAVI